jgi:hypothetical protein
VLNGLRDKTAAFGRRLIMQKWGGNRNPRLIRNIIGRQVDHHVITVIEDVYARGESSFAEVAGRLFSSSGLDIRYITDVVVWVARVLPDNAAAWMGTLMAEYAKAKNQNPVFVHVMLIALFETSAAFANLPSDSTEDGREFENKLHVWLAQLLIDGKTDALSQTHEEALSKAIKAFMKYHLAKYRVCDALQAVIAANDRHMWAKSSVAEFVIRAMGVALMERVYDPAEVVVALSRYREGRNL